MPCFPSVFHESLLPNVKAVFRTASRLDLGSVFLELSRLPVDAGELALTNPIGDFSGAAHAYNPQNKSDRRGSGESWNLGIAQAAERWNQAVDPDGDVIKRP